MIKSLTCLVLLSFVLLGSFPANASDSDSSKLRKTKFIRAFYQAGHVISTNDFVKGVNQSGQPIDNFRSFSLQLGVQCIGNDIWEQIYGYPSYGAGFYHASFSNNTELGTPLAIYGFFIAPFKRWNQFSINYELGLGVTGNWVRFHEENNPFNIAIGSGNTIFVDIGANIRWNISKRFYVDAGFTFTHFSNGAAALPNKGINQAAPRIAIAYNFKKSPTDFIVQEVPKYEKQWEWIIGIAGGAKAFGKHLEIGEDTILRTLNYGIGLINSSINFQISRKVKFGLGVDMAYNGANDPQFKIVGTEMHRQDPNPGGNLMLSVYGSIELVIDRLSVVAQPGWYVARKVSPYSTPAFYQKIGVKYYLFKNEQWYASFMLRAYAFGLADFMEWGAGYCVKW